MNICLDQMKEEVQNVVSEDSDGVASKVQYLQVFYTQPEMLQT